MRLNDETLRLLIERTESEYQKHISLVWSGTPDIKLSQVAWSQEEHGSTILEEIRKELELFVDNISSDVPGSLLENRLASIALLMDGKFFKNKEWSQREQISTLLRFMVLVKSLTSIFINLDPSSAGMSFESFLSLVLGGEVVPVKEGSIIDFYDKERKPYSLKTVVRDEIKGSYQNLIKDFRGMDPEHSINFVLVKKVGVQGHESTDGWLHFHKLDVNKDSFLNLFLKNPTYEKLVLLPKSVFEYYHPEQELESSEDGANQRYIKVGTFVEFLEKNKENLLTDFENKFFENYKKKLVELYDSQTHRIKMKYFFDKLGLDISPNIPAKKQIDEFFDNNISKTLFSDILNQLLEEKLPYLEEYQEAEIPPNISFSITDFYEKDINNILTLSIRGDSLYSNKSQLLIKYFSNQATKTISELLKKYKDHIKEQQKKKKSVSHYLSLSKSLQILKELRDTNPAKFWQALSHSYGVINKKQFIWRNIIGDVDLMVKEIGVIKYGPRSLSTIAHLYRRHMDDKLFELFGQLKTLTNSLNKFALSGLSEELGIKAIEDSKNIEQLIRDTIIKEN